MNIYKITCCDVDFLEPTTTTRPTTSEPIEPPTRPRPGKTKYLLSDWLTGLINYFVALLLLLLLHLYYHHTTTTATTISVCTVRMYVHKTKKRYSKCLPARRQWPNPLLTGLNVEQLRWSRPTRYRYTKPTLFCRVQAYTHLCVLTIFEKLNEQMIK